MAYSMTGFGRGEVILTDRRLSVEIKTVNNRFSDIQIRQPRAFAALENRVRERVGQRLSRGKIDLYINYEDNRPDSCRVHGDTGLARAYAATMQEMAEALELDSHIDLATIIRMNDVLKIEPLQVNPEEAWQLLSTALDSALDQISQMRQLEGTRLCADILNKVDDLNRLHRSVSQRAPRVPEEYRIKLRQRIDELIGEQAAVLFDEQRLSAEVILFADRCAIDEELVRLRSHLDQLKNILLEDNPIGKKLDFLLQEINREINTIGSKANDLELIDSVVQMKSILEMIREQIQNIE